MCAQTQRQDGRTDSDQRDKLPKDKLNTHGEADSCGSWGPWSWSSLCCCRGILGSKVTHRCIGTSAACLSRYCCSLPPSEAQKHCIAKPAPRTARRQASKSARPPSKPLSMHTPTPRHPWACRLLQSPAGRSRTPDSPRPPAPGSSCGSGLPRHRTRGSRGSAVRRRVLRSKKKRGVGKKR